MKKYSAIEKFRIIDMNIHDGIMMSRIAASHKLSLRTIHDWKRRFLLKGLSGLETRIRKDKDQSRILTTNLDNFIKSYALQKPALTIKAIFRNVCLYAKEQNLDTPSYTTVYNCVKAIKPALLTLSHFGAKEYQQKFELIYRREVSGPNQVWQIDHSLLDILLVESKSKFSRPWLTIIFDDFSRAICGYFLSFDAPSAINTALCLRQAIWKKQTGSWPICGIPQTLYTDHGSDFTSDHIQQVCIRLKIRMIHSLVGRPQGRGKIERFFETINECVLAALSGYLHFGKLTSKPGMDLTALSGIIENFIINEYHNKIHTITGQTPLQRWNANGFLPQIPDSLILLDDLLLSIDKLRKVQRDGIRFQGFRYLSPLLAGYVGEMVNIHYDPRDLAEINVYYKDKFLCRCICQDMSGMVVSLKEIQTARNAFKQELSGEIKKSKNFINTIRQGRSQAQNKKEKTKGVINLKLYRND